jgi:hypothetical protein
LVDAFVYEKLGVISLKLKKLFLEKEKIIEV